MKIIAISSEHSNKDAIALVTEPLVCGVEARAQKQAAMDLIEKELALASASAGFRLPVK